MIYCLMVSRGESAGNVFVTELPSGRRNWRRAEVLEQSNRYMYTGTFVHLHYLNHCVMLTKMSLLIIKSLLA